jgi:transcriptional regulator with XRE-family HTH domain
MTTAKTYLAAKLRETGRTGRDLSKVLGIAESRVSALVKGERRLLAKEVDKVARFLGVEPADLLAGMSAPAPADSVPALPPRKSGTITTYQVDAIGGGVGVIDREPVPAPLGPTNLEAFGLRIGDDSNDPVYRARDTVIVDPGLPARPGDDVVISSATIGGGSRVAVGRLDGRDDSQWRIRFYLDDVIRQFPRAQFPRCLPIVARLVA